MKKYWRILIFWFIAASLIWACAIFPYFHTAKNTTPTTVSASTSKCSLLPPTFKKADLIGVWMASYTGGDDTDTLIIREDGTYKQTYDSPLANLHYESGWQKWWIEDRESGFLRLHMKGMRLCDDIDSICRRTSGGLDPTEYTAIDYCENQVITMPDETVLIVTGVSDLEKNTFPRGITLRQTRIAGSDWTWSFHLQDTEQK